MFKWKWKKLRKKYFKAFKYAMERYPWAYICFFKPLPSCDPNQSEACFLCLKLTGLYPYKIIDLKVDIPKELLKPSL